MIETLEEAAEVVGELQQRYDDELRGAPMPENLELLSAEAVAWLRERGVDVVGVRVRDLGWGPEGFGHVVHLEVELGARYGPSAA